MPVSVWTSTLRRTIQTAEHLPFPKLRWKVPVFTALPTKPCLSPLLDEPSLFTSLMFDAFINLRPLLSLHSVKCSLHTSLDEQGRSYAAPSLISLELPRGSCVKFVVRETAVIC